MLFGRPEQSGASITGGSDSQFPFVMLLPLVLLLCLPLARSLAGKRRRALAGASAKQRISNKQSGLQGETEAAKRRLEKIDETMLQFSDDEVLQQRGELPAGWLEHADKLQRPYYVHAATGLSQWERPTADEGASALARREEVLLQQGIDTEALPPVAPSAAGGDLVEEIISRARRCDSVVATGRKRRQTTLSQTLGLSLLADGAGVNEAVAAAQHAAEEAQAAARLKSATAQEHFSQEEVGALCSHVSSLLHAKAEAGRLLDDSKWIEVGRLLPLTPTTLAASATGSLLLAEYLRAVDPESLDQRALNYAGQGHRGMVNVAPWQCHSSAYAQPPPQESPISLVSTIQAP